MFLQAVLFVYEKVEVAIFGVGFACLALCYVLVFENGGLVQLL